MQKTSALYQELLSADHRVETRLTIGETGVLITKQGDRITFGSKAYDLTARGSLIQINDTDEAPLAGLRIFGKTTQNGTPTPDAPVPLESVGESVNVTVCGKNLLANNRKTDDTTVSVNYKCYEDGRFSLEGTATAASVVCLYPTTPVYNYGNIGTGKPLFLMKAGKRYYLSGAQVACRKVSDGTGVFFRSANEISAAAQYVYTPTEDLEVMQFRAYIENGRTYTSDVIFEPTFSLAPMSVYEQAVLQTLPIFTPKGLPGVPVSSSGNYTDENGQQWVCDEVDFEKGQYIQRIYSYTFTGQETINSFDSGKTLGRDIKLLGLPSCIVPKKASGSNVSPMLCTHEAVTTQNALKNDSGGIAVAVWNNTQYLYFSGTYYGDANGLKTAMAEAYASGTPYVWMYALETPIIRELTEAEKVDYTALHTNYPNTTVFNDGGAGMEVVYTMNGDGPTGVLTGTGGAEAGYDETLLISMETDRRVFSEDSPTVGACISGQIDIRMLKPFGEIPTRARMVPYVRLTDGSRFSEWIQKGVFYIDTRGKAEDGSDIEKIQIHGYDDMLKAEQDYPASTLEWPAKDIDVVREIAEFIGVSIDPRTIPIINRGYLIQYPTGYSCRDVLGYIAAAYAGCFVMSDLGELRLVTINGIPKETRYLMDAEGFAITIGGDRILV